MTNHTHQTVLLGELYLRWGVYINNAHPEHVPSLIMLNLFSGRNSSSIDSLLSLSQPHRRSGFASATNALPPLQAEQGARSHQNGQHYSRLEQLSRLRGLLRNRFDRLRLAGR